MPRKTPTEKQEHAARLAFWRVEYARRNPDFRQGCELYEAQVRLCNELLGWDVSPWRQLEFFAACAPEGEREHAAILQGLYDAFVVKHALPPLPPASWEWSLEILYHIAAGRARKFTKNFQPFLRFTPSGTPDASPSWEGWKERHKASLVWLHDAFRQVKGRLGLRQEQEEARAIGLFLFDLVDSGGLTLSQAVYLIQGGIPPHGAACDQFTGLFPRLREGDSWRAANNRPWRVLLKGTRACVAALEVLPLYD